MVRGWWSKWKKENYQLIILARYIHLPSIFIPRTWQILGQMWRSFLWHRFCSKGHPIIINFVRETGSLSPATFSSVLQFLMYNSRRDVRWRKPMQSRVSRLERLQRRRDLREGGSKPSSGKDLMPSHGPHTSREVTMSMHTHALPLTSFLQLLIETFIKLGGIPPTGNDSICWQLDMLRFSIFGTRVPIWSGNDFNLSQS